MTPSSGARRPHRLASVLGLVGLFAALPARAHDGHAPLPSKGATVQGNQLLLSEPARRAIGVETAKVTLADLERTVRAQAQVQLPWHQQALVTTLIPGRIARVLVRPGDRVEPGQPLALIEGLELEGLQRELLRALAERALADRLLAQREGLGRSDAIAMTVILEARRDAAEAAALVEITIRKLLALGLSDADLKRVQESRAPIRSLPITSPIRGEVVHADVRAGQVVATDEHLFHVVDLAEVEIAGQVLESELALVAIGQPVQARFTALPGVDFPGRIEHTHLRVDPGTRTLTVIAHAANPEHLLRPGMSGLMTIRVGFVDQAIVAPVAAIAGSGDARFVFLERAAGRYERRRVSLGSRSGDLVEILDGVFPGDQVVVTGTGLLTGLFPAEPGRSDRARSPTTRPVAEQAPDDGRSASHGPIVAHADIELPVERRHYASTQVEGRIARILVKPGDRVRAGQVLAEVESLPLRSLQLDLLRTKARHEWTRDLVERGQSLAVTQAAPRIELWRAETSLDVMTQTIDEIRAKLLALGLDRDTLERLESSRLDAEDRRLTLDATVPIRSPADGQLEHFDVVPGQVVRPSGPGGSTPSAAALFEVLDRSKLWVRAYIREADVARVQVGQIARVSVPAIPGLHVRGAVVRISPVFEPGLRLLPVWIEVENSDGRLFEGMQAGVVLEPAAPPDGVVRRPAGGS